MAKKPKTQSFKLEHLLEMADAVRIFRQGHVIDLTMKMHKEPDNERWVLSLNTIFGGGKTLSMACGPVTMNDEGLVTVQAQGGHTKVEPVEVQLQFITFDNIDIDYADTFVEQMKAHGYWD